MGAVKTPGGRVPAVCYKMLNEYNILIAGTVGSGKSTLINSFLYTLAKTKTCGQSENGCGIVLLDPKRVELKQWESLPHCMGRAETPEKIARLLNGVIKIMDTRYKAMAKQGLKTWNSFKIYVIVDELADLMLNNKKTFLPLLQKILQLGRAAGIVLICGTQCPNRIVIPAAMQVNFTCRIALKCLSSIESRQACGVAGAELQPLYDYIYISGCEKDTGTIPLIDGSELKNIIEYWQ